MIDDSVIDKYIRENKKSLDIVKEVCCVFIPSVKQLFRVLRKNGIFIDTQDKDLKEFIQKNYFLSKKKDFQIEDRLNYFGLKKGDALEDRIKFLEENVFEVTCKELGYGKIIKKFSSGMFTVKFKDFELPIMAIKDGNGYCLSTTDNPRWHKIILKESNE